jgi:hypothetical protein
MGGGGGGMHKRRVAAACWHLHGCSWQRLGSTHRHRLGSWQQQQQQQQRGVHIRTSIPVSMPGLATGLWQVLTDPHLS